MNAVRRRQLREAHASLETLMSDYGLGAAARSPEVLRRPRTASVVDRRRRAAPRADERAATLAEQRVRVELRPHGGDGEAPTPKVARRG